MNKSSQTYHLLMVVIWYLFKKKQQKKCFFSIINWDMFKCGTCLCLPSLFLLLIWHASSITTLIVCVVFIQEFKNKQVEAVNTVNVQRSTKRQGQEKLTETNKQREAHS